MAVWNPLPCTHIGIGTRLLYPQYVLPLLAHSCRKNSFQNKCCRQPQYTNLDSSSINDEKCGSKSPLTTSVCSLYCPASIFCAYFMYRKPLIPYDPRYPHQLLAVALSLSQTSSGSQHRQTPAPPPLGETAAALRSPAVFKNPSSLR